MKDEVYLQPQAFIFGMMTSVLTSMIMGIALRRAETQGRAAMIQFDQNDVELREVIGHTMGDLAIALEAMEASIDFGKSVRVTLCTELMPADEMLDNLYLGMVTGGCHVSQPTARAVEGIPTTEFVLRKGSPAWAMLIPLLIPLGTVGLVAFGLAKIESISKALMPLMLVTVGGFIILVALLRRPAEKLIESGGAEKLIGAGKLPIKRIASTTLKKAVAAR